MAPHVPKSPLLMIVLLVVIVMATLGASMAAQGVFATAPTRMHRDLFVRDSSVPAHQFPLLAVSTIALALPDRWVAIQIEPFAPLRLYFTEPDCQGTEFVSVSGWVPPLAVLHSDGFVVSYPNGGPSPQTIQLVIDGDACVAANYILTTAVPLSRFDLRDAGVTSPITPPFEVVSTPGRLPIRLGRFIWP
jgi:hypothetical protein